MNILHIYKDYFPVLGGIENHLKMLAEAQVQAGHDVAVLVCSPDAKTYTEMINGVQVIKAGRLLTAASMPLSIAQPWQILRRKPDITHIQSPYPLGEFANWLVGRAKASVITYQSDVVRQKNLLRVYGPILKQVLRKVDRIITSTPRYIESSTWLQPVSEKCRPVPLAVDTTRFTPVERTPTDTLKLLFVGRLRYYKGLDTLLKALPATPNVHVTLGGTGPMEVECRALVTELNLSSRVTFAGDITDEDLPSYYQQADAFVLPSNARSEAFGIVLLEAMATGLPCISTELGTGTSWIVQDGVTGLVVPPKDPPKLAEAINKLASDVALRQQFGKAGLERIRTTFTPERMVSGIMEVYEEAISS